MGARAQEVSEVNLRRELAQPMADHVLRDGHIVVNLAIVHLKP